MPPKNVLPASPPNHGASSIAAASGVSEDLYDIFVDIEPENGCIIVYGVGEEYTAAF